MSNNSKTPKSKPREMAAVQALQADYELLAKTRTALNDRLAAGGFNNSPRMLRELAIAVDTVVRAGNALRDREVAMGGSA